MLRGLIGDGTAASLLKGELDASSARVREVAHRVANAATPAAAGGFAGALDAAQAADGAAGVELEAEMVVLADEQIRNEAATRLLQKVYAQIRSSVRER